MLHGSSLLVHQNLIFFREASLCIRMSWKHPHILWEPHGADCLILILDPESSWHYTFPPYTSVSPSHVVLFVLLSSASSQLASLWQCRCWSSSGLRRTEDWPAPSSTSAGVLAQQDFEKNIQDLWIWSLIFFLISKYGRIVNLCHKIWRGSNNPIESGFALFKTFFNVFFYATRYYSNVSPKSMSQDFLIPDLAIPMYVAITVMRLN